MYNKVTEKLLGTSNYNGRGKMFTPSSQDHLDLRSVSVTMILCLDPNYKTNWGYSDKKPRLGKNTDYQYFTGHEGLTRQRWSPFFPVYKNFKN